MNMMRSSVFFSMVAFAPTVVIALALVLAGTSNAWAAVDYHCQPSCDNGCMAYSYGYGSCPYRNPDLSITCANSGPCQGCSCKDHDPGWGEDCWCDNGPV